MTNTKFFLLLSLFLLTACGPAPTATSAPPVTNTYRFKPLPATWTPSPIFTPSLAYTITNTKFPTPTILPTLSSSSLTPGIYPVYRQEGNFYVWIDPDPKNIAPLGISTDDNNAIPSPDGHLIAYMSDGFIYTKNIINGDVERIPQPDGGSFDKFWQGSWSPDGKYLTYAMNAVNVDGDKLSIEELPSIYIAGLAEKTYVKVTIWKTLESTPVWSPDGKWIVFMSDHANPGAIDNFVGFRDLYIMSTNCLPNLDSCKDQPKRRLTQFGIKGDVDHPSWNPNGRSIGFVFINSTTRQRDIYSVDLNGAITNLTDTSNSDEGEFSWSADGNRIVYKKDDDKGRIDLYAMDIATRTEVPITDSPNIAEGKPYWSPDNNSIAYFGNIYADNYNFQIFSLKNSALLNIDGSDKEFLFWLTIFPEIQPGAVLQVSPSGNNVNLRQGPSIIDASLAKLQTGDILKIVGTTVNKQNEVWWNIDSNNINGWVRQIYNWYLPVGNHPFSP